jgi:hypothetical protein
LLQLGNATVERIDPAQNLPRRLDAVLGLLDTVPEDAGLHLLAIEICEEAARAAAE